METLSDLIPHTEKCPTNAVSKKCKACRNKYFAYIAKIRRKKCKDNETKTRTKTKSELSKYANVICDICKYRKQRDFCDMCKREYSRASKAFNRCQNRDQNVMKSCQQHINARRNQKKIHTQYNDTNHFKLNTTCVKKKVQPKL